ACAPRTRSRRERWHRPHRLLPAAAASGFSWSIPPVTVAPPGAGMFHFEASVAKLATAIKAVAGTGLLLRLGPVTPRVQWLHTRPPGGAGLLHERRHELRRHR